MGYRELIKRVQVYSGFSDKEAKEALEHMVESIAIRLTEGERKDFASQLPEKLQDIALSVRATTDRIKKDMVEEFMETQAIKRERAMKQIHAAWDALKDAITPGEVDDIRAQLPNKTVAFLH